jgi:D-arabinose 1-dehydrogenase-like Zn-dependent alcohol dehydrogenase
VGGGALSSGGGALSSGGGALSSSGAKEKFAMELGANEYLDASQGDLAEGLQRLGEAVMVVCTAPNPKIIGGLVDGLEPQGKLLILSRESRLFGCTLPLACWEIG